MTERRFPGLRRLDRIGRAEHQQVRYGTQACQLLHRLMGGAVFAQPDGVVGHDMDHPKAHQGRQPNGGTAVVGKRQKGAAVGNEAAMQRQTVHRRGHAVLAHAVVQVTPREILRGDRLRDLGLGPIGPAQIGRAADQGRQSRGETLEHLLRGLPGRQLGRLLAEAALDLLNRDEKLIGQAPLDSCFEGFPDLGLQHGEPVLPGAALGLAATAGNAPGQQHASPAPRRADGANPAPPGSQQSPPPPAARHGSTPEVPCLLGDP